MRRRPYCGSKADMKPQLRLALPPLASLTAATTILFVLLDRNGRVARSGEMSPAQLSAIAPSGRAHAILQPGEAVVATIDLPPLPARRRHAAVLGQIEPMVLDDLEVLRSEERRVGKEWTGWRGADTSV